MIGAVWLFLYLNYSTNGLPLGWDTPYYIWKMNSATRDGTLTFISNERYYHILYPLIGSWVSLTGLTAFSVELVLPLSLWAGGFLTAVSIVNRETADWKSSIIAAGASATWFGFFRLVSDLHASLLALVLMLIGTYIFLRLQKESDSRHFVLGLSVMATVVLAASFAHVEMALFISAIWLLALTLRVWVRQLQPRKFAPLVFAVLVPLLPSLVAYSNQLRIATSPLEGRLPSITTMSHFAWALYLGPVGIALIGTIPIVSRSLRQFWLSSPFSTLAISWVAVSIGTGVAQYLHPSFTPFSERAVILSPTLFLAPVVLSRLRSVRFTKLKGALLVTVVITGTAASYYVLVGPLYYNSFITDSASVALEDIRSLKLIDPKRSVFVFSEVAPFAGGLAEHSNNWVSAYLGDHYSYLGRIDFLMAGLEAPFSDDQSKLISRLFFNQLPLNQISNLSIVYVTDFNIPRPIPDYNLSFLRPLARGVYLVDQSKWWSQNRTIIAAYSSVLSSSEGWRSEVQDWAYSGKSLKFDLRKPGPVATMRMDFAVPRTSQYGISIRVWDTALGSNPISVSIDGSITAMFRYNGTLTPVEPTAFAGNLDAGVHTISFAIDNQANLAQFMSFDYISITRLGP